ncbi:unnamed protein product, partial [Symbiodinium microadriaticum]
VQAQGRGNDHGDHQRSGHTMGGAQGSQKDRLCQADRPFERSTARAANKSARSGGKRGTGADVAATRVERGEPKGDSSPGRGTADGPDLQGGHARV